MAECNDKKVIINTADNQFYSPPASIPTTGGSSTAANQQLPPSASIPTTGGSSVAVVSTQGGNLPKYPATGGTTTNSASLTHPLTITHL
jgi:hypothetical protein